MLEKVPGSGVQVPALFVGVHPVGVQVPVGQEGLWNDVFITGMAEAPVTVPVADRPVGAAGVGDCGEAEDSPESALAAPISRAATL
jgi:hypothetical protein